MRKISWQCDKCGTESVNYDSGLPKGWKARSGNHLCSECSRPARTGAAPQKGADVEPSLRSAILATVDKPPEFRALVERLREIQKLQQGWDGAKSTSVAQEALASAIRAAAILATERPHVAPVPGGGVQFELEVGDRYLELEILPSGAMLALLMLAGDVISEGEIIESQLPAAVTWTRQKGENSMKKTWWECDTCKESKFCDGEGPPKGWAYAFARIQVIEPGTGAILATVNHENDMCSYCVQLAKDKSNGQSSS